MDNDLEEKKNQLYQLLKLDDVEKRIQEIDLELANQNIWNDHEQASKLSQERAKLDKLLTEWLETETEIDISKLETQALMNGVHDSGGAVLSIHAGSGGTEAMDWASILERMYLRWAERNNFFVVEIDRSIGEEAGIKSVTFEINGSFVYGRLQSEAGTHRLVRMSPFDADHARHTSFALVEVIPLLENDTEIEIDSKDIKFDFYRSGGHGGQNVNKVSTAVRITHIPTGIVVNCQNERFQAQNREKAMKILKAKLIALQEKTHLTTISELKGEHKEAAWGNQIRSYVLAPYQLVKDHRTEYSESNPNAVLDGKIDGFIEAYLRYQKSNIKSQNDN